MEYCLRNPHWLSLNTLNSSENVFSLSFNIDVKKVYLGSLIWLLVENCLGHIYFLCFLNIGLMLPINHISGVINVRLSTDNCLLTITGSGINGDRSIVRRSITPKVH